MNIAIFTKNWIGDVVFETPAIHAIKDNFPDARLIAITPKRCAEVLRVNPDIAEVVVFDDRNEDKGVISKWQLIRRLKALKIDQIYLFHRSFSRALIATFAGIRERIGYDTKGRGLLLTRAVREPSDGMHAVQYFLHLLQSTGLRVSGDYQYAFYYSEQDRLKVSSLLEKHRLDPAKLVAINPGANWLPKRWPVECFRQLAHQLVRRYGVQVAITGSKEDETLGEVIMNGDGAHSSIVSLCGKTTLCELGAFFSLCRLLVSNDSGPLHIGAGVGTNVLGIFGPTDPTLTGPLGRGRNVVVHYVPDGARVPWYGKNFPFGNWLEHISVDHVLKTIEREQLLV